MSLLLEQLPGNTIENRYIVHLHSATFRNVENIRSQWKRPEETDGTISIPREDFGYSLTFYLVLGKYPISCHEENAKGFLPYILSRV